MHILVLPDGTEISSGPGTYNAIRSVTVTRTVNSGQELTLGSVCADELEVTLITPGNALAIRAGAELTLYKQTEAGRKQLGVFLAQTPTRPSANTLKILGYSKISLLNRDLTAWLETLSWPCTLAELAALVCAQCGLTLKTAAFPNSEISVPHFFKTGVTGTAILGHIARAAGRFVHCDAQGQVELGWYAPSGVSLYPGDYFTAALADYAVAPVDAVQLRLGGQGAYLFPDTAAENPYIFREEPFLQPDVAVLHEIQAQLAGLTYRPGKVVCPYREDISPGDILMVHTLSGQSHPFCVMRLTHRGRRLTLEGFGSEKRSQAVPTTAQTVANAIAGQTQQDIFHRLTNGGTAQGVYLEDGQLYINASYLKSGVILADLIKAGILQSADGETFRLDLDKGTLTMKGSGVFGGRSPGDTYISVDGSELCVYDEQGVATIRIGQHRTNSLFQLPYIKFYTRRTESSVVDSPGLLCRTPLGLWVGNAELDLDSLDGPIGVGLTDASAGIFISTVENKVTVYRGTRGADIYTGEAIAKFA